MPMPPVGAPVAVTAAAAGDDGFVLPTLSSDSRVDATQALKTELLPTRTDDKRSAGPREEVWTVPMGN
ncbi:hypothetical protein M419DRAFT_117122 [Trichoderma reesei RUT C-30]|uniref:Uncharacterized protein n=1 Tax=Hypocrea jecorina (strain ATCC 56765 / BCRC 32924 / NRRL 11460 / Rut C-30) TaxID=1344414 RepID=A0A024SMM5_HYPJR|nr:hypothetical protein M419DRAFT_117122 [Trichoderma reesei RUT C-30]